MSKKYELTGMTREFKGITLHRIRALQDFDDIKAGDLGGWVESEDNLTQTNNCWIHSGIVCDQAKVSGNAHIVDSELRDNAHVYGRAYVIGSIISGDAIIFGGKVEYATVSDHAEIFDEAKILGIQNNEDLTVINGHAEVYENAIVYFSSQIGGKAKIHGNAQVLGKISGRAEICGNTHLLGNASEGKIIGTKYIYP